MQTSTRPASVRSTWCSRLGGCTLPQDAVTHGATSYYWKDGQMVTLTANQCPPER